MTAVIYNFNDYAKKKNESLRVSYGFPKEVWDFIEESGYDVHDPEAIDQFFYDLGEEEEEEDV
jgi:hypothetical protein